MSRTHVSPSVQAFIREVESVGGSVRLSKDGHVMIYSRSGAFVVKVKASGKGVADGKGATGRHVMEQVLRKVRER